MSYQAAIDEAEARTAANDAKAAEALGLINRGAGASYESAFFAPASAIVGWESPRRGRSCCGRST